MRRQLVFIGVLAALLCLWTVVAQAITLNVTDDTFTQQETPGTSFGALPTLSVDNLVAGSEHITYALFDLGLLYPSVVIDTAVLRFFVNKVTQGGKINIFVVTSGSVPAPAAPLHAGAVMTPDQLNTERH